MKGRYWITAALVALATMGVASAATLNPSQIGTVGGGECLWHFVNNRTGGAAAGVLTATYVGAFTVGATTVLQNTQHFFIETSGGATLLGASTNLPGGLLLSSLECDFKEPPPCDPKNEVCPK